MNYLLERPHRRVSLRGATSYTSRVRTGGDRRGLSSFARVRSISAKGFACGSVRGLHHYFSWGLQSNGVRCHSASDGRNCRGCLCFMGYRMTSRFLRYSFRIFYFFVQSSATVRSDRRSSPPFRLSTRLALLLALS